MSAIGVIARIRQICPSDCPESCRPTPYRRSLIITTKNSGAGRDAKQPNISQVMDDTLDQTRKQENAMLPLNDEWLSWPPESLDSFFSGSPQVRYDNDICPKEQAPARQQQQEHDHEASK